MTKHRMSNHRAGNHRAGKHGAAAGEPAGRLIRAASS